MNTELVKECLNLPFVPENETLIINKIIHISFPQMIVLFCDTGAYRLVRESLDPLCKRIREIPLKSNAFPMMVYTGNKNWMESIKYPQFQEECEYVTYSVIVRKIKQWPTIKMIDLEMRKLMESKPGDFADIHLKVASDKAIIMNGMTLCFLKPAAKKECLFVIMSKHPDGVYNRVVKVNGGYHISDHECVLCGKKSGLERILCPFRVHDVPKYLTINEEGEIME